MSRTHTTSWDAPRGLVFALALSSLVFLGVAGRSLAQGLPAGPDVDARPTAPPRVEASGAGMDDDPADRVSRAAPSTVSERTPSTALSAQPTTQASTPDSVTPSVPPPPPDTASPAADTSEAAPTSSPVSPIMDDDEHRGRFAIECFTCESNDDGFVLMNGRLTGEFRMTNVGDYPLHIWIEETTGLDVTGVTWTLHPGAAVQLELRACSPIQLEGPGTLVRQITIHNDSAHGPYTYDLTFAMVPGQPIYPCNY